MNVAGSLILAIVMVLVVLVMLRNGRLREKYAILWLVIGGLTIILGLFPRLLNWAASVVGIVVPANLLFSLSILLLVGVSLHVSRELTILEDETRILAEEVAILRAGVDQLQSQLTPSQPSTDDGQTDSPTPPTERR
ncbi:DUF2304 domain-containing protein [Arthrobacter sp. FW305-BF8]|uniref:DUF2304 domain-containing protein n=1 Tax=Arthrobacter sp. FW305-BF8 TaxID=2879617 RepID=UPI001F1D695F|nr:DUF2304 domain-containing protein [Arthrobacter sp. FW305-BF8]UKA52948.1 DUF2304 domain-containing protein [Arthrobacter sp. FW305-BF8]